MVLRPGRNPLCARSSLPCLSRNHLNLVLSIFSNVLHKFDVRDMGL
jgi:hypothetical protein